MRKILLGFGLLLSNILSGNLACADDVSLTLYSSADPASFDPQRFIANQSLGNDPNFAWQVPGFGVVRDTREFELKSGINQMRLTDVAAFIDPTSVSFLDLSDANASSLLEQNFEFDLANADKILDRYLEREIGVALLLGEKTTELKGKLISHTGNSLVLQTTRGIEIVNTSAAHLMLGELPGGLISRPTLVLKLNSNSAGKRAFRTTYQTDGMTWRADYNLVLNQAETEAELGAWVSLLNLSGASFKDAKLKLIAGDVQRIKAAQQDLYEMQSARQHKAAGLAGDSFEEKSFFEYHMYTLPRRINLLANSTQQIALFPSVGGVQVEKTLLYYGNAAYSGHGFFSEPQLDRALGTQSNTKLDIYIRFKNKKENKLGLPLPKGKVRVFKQDQGDGSLEFIGEDLIDHTARDEEVLVKIGQAFDVVGERKQTNYQIDLGARTISESFKIEIKNHKDSAQSVLVKENLFRWSTWNIVEKSQEFEKVDARTIHFKVEIPARQSKVVTYTVKYTW